jgi:hypothetical protein
MSQTLSLEKHMHVINFLIDNVKGNGYGGVVNPPPLNSSSAVRCNNFNLDIT